MTDFGRRVVICVPLLLMWLAPSAGAQEIATSFEQLRGLVKTDDTVVVTEASGRQTTGRLGPQAGRHRVRH